MILRNARVDGVLHDIAVHGGQIVADGAGEVVDLDGRWLLPGLWDHHVHFDQWATRARRLDVSLARSAAETAALVRARIAERPGELVTGYGFRDGLWPDQPTAEILESSTPVVLVSGDVHCTWANRAALARFGLPDDAWLLREQDAFDLSIRLSAWSEAEIDGWALEAAAQAAARGVVGIVDFEMDDAAAAWRRRVAAGFRGLRVRAAVYPERLDAALPTGTPIGGLVTGGPLKLFTDGSLNTRSAWCDEPYPGTDDVGVAVHDADELLELARAGVTRGLTPAIHAIGDRAVTLALDTFAALRRLEPRGSGGTVEHAQLIQVADLPRFAALGVTASVQPEHAMDDRDVADRYWAGRTDRAFPYRSLMEAGARLTFGSDAPVAPLDPWVAMDTAVTRSRDGRAPWHPEQALTRRQALDASTESRIAPGQPADLVVVDADPATAQLRDMPVHATMVAGEWSYRA